MGMIEKVTCTSCGARWECMTGCGIMHGELERVIKLFSENMQKDIMIHIGKSEFPLFDFGYQLAYCKHCGTIESVPVLKLPDCQKEYTGSCPTCGQRAELIEDIEQTPCPVCHKEALTAEETGMWD